MLILKDSQSCDLTSACLFSALLQLHSLCKLPWPHPIEVHRLAGFGNDGPCLSRLLVPSQRWSSVLERHVLDLKQIGMVIPPQRGPHSPLAGGKASIPAIHVICAFLQVRSMHRWKRRRQVAD